jgi:hypothetical protein
MTYGYQKAGRRYHGLKKYGIGFHELAYQVFAEIEARVDQCLEVAEEGDMLIVETNLKALRVEVWIDYGG